MVLERKGQIDADIETKTDVQILRERQYRGNTGACSVGARPEGPRPSVEL